MPAAAKTRSLRKKEAQKPVPATGPRTLTIEVLYPVDPLPVAHVNFVKFSQLSGELLMDVGTIDDQKAIARLTGTDSEEDQSKAIKAYVMSRFGMAPQTFAMLRRNVDDLWNKMKASGALKQLGLEETNAE